MDSIKLREKYQAAVSAVEEIQARMTDAEDVSAEDKAAFDKAVADANAIDAEAVEAERREAQLNALRERTDRVGHAPKLAHEDPKNTRSGKHQYSITRAVSAQMRGVALDGIEGEVDADLRKERTVATRGVLVPMSTDINYRAFSAAGGSYTAVRGPIQDALRSRLVLSALGSPVIVNSGLFKIPLGGSGGGFWVTNTAPTKADRSIGALAFSVHTVGGRTTIDRQTLTTANVDTEGYIWDALVADIASTYQAGCFHGTNADGQPLGLFGYTNGTQGINVKAMGTDGDALDYAALLSMVGASETANSPDGQAWVTSPALAAKLEGTVKVASQANFLLDAASKTIIGRPYMTTSSVKANLTKGSGTALSAIAFGPWSLAIQAFFSAIDVYADPYSGQDGSVTLTGLLDADFGVTRPAAFSICVDAETV